MKINANTRLSGLNPLRGLDLEGLVNLLEQGERGYYANLQWLYRMILRRNAMARAVKRKLSGAIGRLDWNIKIPDNLDGGRKAIAEKQQQALRTAYDRITNLRAALVHLAFADILGFAHLEKIYAAQGDDPWTIKELRIVPQWFWCRDGRFAPWEYNPSAENVNRGRPIDPRHWIIREVDDPAAEIFAFAHLKMQTTDADWDQFSDTYAVPPIFAEMPPGVRREDMAEYQRIAERIVSDGRGAHPYQAKVYSLHSGSDGVSVFTERLRYYREEIVLAGTGGILTTLDGSTGIGKGPSEEHQDTWLEIAADIGTAVTEAMQQQFDLPFLRRMFPDAEPLAYFELDKPEATRGRAEIIADAKELREAGYAIETEELSEKVGYKLAAAPDASSQPAAAQPGNPASAPAPAPAPGAEPAPERDADVPSDVSLVQQALADDLDIEARWLAPVADILSEIQGMLADESIPLEDVAAKIQQAADKMPELLGSLDIEALADALEKTSGAGVYAGLVEAMRQRRQKTTTRIA